MQIGQRKTDRKGRQISQLRGGCKEKSRQRRTDTERQTYMGRKREREGHTKRDSHVQRGQTDKV